MYWHPLMPLWIPPQVRGNAMQSAQTFLGEFRRVCRWTSHPQHCTMGWGPLSGLKCKGVHVRARSRGKLGQWERLLVVTKVGGKRLIGLYVT